MTTYQNKTNKSCVYDAFENAGLPTTPNMMMGVKIDTVVELLEEYGYTTYKKGTFVSLPDGYDFFCLRDTGCGYHLEHYYDWKVFEEMKYKPEEVCFISIQSKKITPLHKAARKISSALSKFANSRNGNF